MFANLKEKLSLPKRGPSEEVKLLELLCSGTKYLPVVVGRNVNGHHERAMFLNVKDENGNTEPMFELKVKKSLFKTTYELYEKNIDHRGVFSSKLYGSYCNLASVREALGKPVVDDAMLKQRYRPSVFGKQITDLWCGAAQTMKGIKAQLAKGASTEHQ